MSAEHGWTTRRDVAGWRRVVPSPEPHHLPELPTIRRLLEAGCVPGRATRSRS